MTGYAKSDTATTESYTETDSSYDDGGRSPATPRRNRRVRQPSEPPPMVPEMDQPVPDVSLTSSTKGALLSAFAEGIPRGSALLYRDVFEEVHGQTADSSQFRGDPRWFLLYNHPLLVGLGLWIGARTFLDRRGMSPEDTSLAGNRPLGQLAEDLEVHFGYLLGRALDQFWEAGGNDEDNGGEGYRRIGHSTDGLALVVALANGVLFTKMTLHRPAVARSFIRHLVAIWAAAGVPGEESLEPDLSCQDDFLFAQIWITTFWTTYSFDLLIAANAKTVPLFDPAVDYPTLPVIFPATVLASIKPPSQREVNGPTPEHVLSRAIPIRAREYLSWMDPEKPPPKDIASTRDLTLSRCISGISEAGFTHLIILLFYLGLKTSSFRIWVKEIDNLSMIDVLLAEELIRRGAAVNPSEGAASKRAAWQKYADEANVDISYFDKIMSNAKIGEAIRRRNHLRVCSNLIEQSLPKEMAFAARTSNYRELVKHVPDIFLSFLVIMRSVLMMVGSPEPFEDLKYKESPDETAASPTTVSDADEPDTLLRIWFHSTAFFEASSSAMVVSRNLAMIITNWGPEKLASSLYIGFLCNAAVHAAWFHLLVLQRFRWLVAESTEAERARALSLYNSIQSDIKVCLEVLEISGKSHFEEQRIMLRSLLDGDRTSLSPTELQMLRLARKVVLKCPHMEGADSTGTCWICATNQSPAMRRGSLTGLGSDDPMAQIREAGGNNSDRGSKSSRNGTTTLSGGSSSDGTLPRKSNGKKRVRFSDEDEIWETHHKEDYPARSQRAPDHPEDVIANQARMKVDEEANTLALMLLQREIKDISTQELPNLLDTWRLWGRA